MGGKTWSEKEEAHFWRVAISSSPKRIGKDLAKPEKSWERLAREMQHAMGIEARRKYTPTMLFEHFFQNVETGRKSPNAVVYVMEYLARRGPDVSNTSRAKPTARLSRIRRRRLVNAGDNGQGVSDPPIGRPTRRPTNSGLPTPPAVQQPAHQAARQAAHEPTNHATHYQSVSSRRHVRLGTPILESAEQSEPTMGSESPLGPRTPAAGSPESSSDGQLTDMRSIFSAAAEDRVLDSREGTGYSPMQGEFKGDYEPDEQLMVPWV